MTLFKKCFDHSTTPTTYCIEYGGNVVFRGTYNDGMLFMKAYENGGKNSPVITEHFGDIYFKLGDKIQALIFWEKAKELGKGSKFLDKKIAEKMLYE